MSLLIEHPAASNSLKFKYNFQERIAEKTFDFGPNLGDFNSTGIITNDQFSSVLDGDPVVKHFQNMTINVGHTVTPMMRCKGMYILVEGDLTVNGILSMTARGAFSPGKFIGVDPTNEKVYFDSVDIFSEKNIFTIGDIGGNGILRSNGENGKNNAPGGGGAGGDGGALSDYSNHIGGNATSFSGGSGGGGYVSSPSGQKAGNPGSPEGGAGGAGRYVGGTAPGYGGGGAGNPPGVGYRAGIAGTGGLIILIVKGNIIFGTAGKIESVGSNGGASKNGQTSVAYAGGGGGASGGGAIHLFCKNALPDLSKFNVSGGIGGTSLNNGAVSRPGKNGGNGSISLNAF